MKELDLKKIKSDLIIGYDTIAQNYGGTRNERFDAFLKEDVGRFVNAISQVGIKVVDLGSGTGSESLLLKKAGLLPICIDSSLEMAKTSHTKGLNTCVMDFYNLGFPNNTFDGVWMSFSFLHVPKKNALEVLNEVRRVLAHNGILYISLFEGEGEGPKEQDVKKCGIARYFSYYQQDELRQLLSSQFSIVDSSRLDISPRPTISFLCQNTNTEYEK